VQILGFGISIIIARILMPKDFGIMAIVMMLIGYSNLLTNFGLGEAVIQKNIRDKKTINTIFTFDLSISILLAIMFYTSAEFIADYFNTPEVKAVVKTMSVIFILTSFNVLPLAILRRDLDFKAVSILEMGKLVLMSVVTLILAINQYGYWALVYGQIIAISIFTIALCIKAGWVPRLYYNHSSFRDVYNFGVWTFIRAQLVFFGQHFDRFIVGKWFGAMNLGFYDKAITLSRTPYESITKNINSVMYSSFSALKKEKEKIKSQYAKSMLIISYINIPMYLGLYFVAPYFVSSLLGDKWEPMTIPFQIVLLGYLLTSYTGLQSSLNVGIGKYREFTIRLLYSLILFIVSCIILLPYGVIGVAISFFIYCLAQNILSISLTIKNIGISWINVVAIVFPAFVPTVFMSIILYFISLFYLKEHTVVNMIYLIAIGITSYGSYVFFDTSGSARNIKEQLWKDIRTRF
jgi:PST family polysaccharide transporter